MDHYERIARILRRPSGPGRLHDLCVRLVAASPGQIKSGGAGWTLAAGFIRSPFGTCLIASSPRGICHVSFVGSGAKRAALKALKREWPRAEVTRDDRWAASIAKRIFRRRSGHVLAVPSPLLAFVRGTKFQVQVWRALLRVPQGKRITYGGLARYIQKPGASRAVGSAVGANPIAYLIPCHRVIRQTGAVGGYHWGVTRKKAMLAWESTAKR